MSSAIEDQQGDLNANALDFRGEGLQGGAGANPKSIDLQLTFGTEVDEPGADKNFGARPATTAHVQPVHLRISGNGCEAESTSARPVKVESHPWTGSDAVVHSLIEQGVTTLFGYPGGAIMPIYDALYNAEELSGGTSQLRHILVRHEQGATHAAEAYARVTGKVGVCMATSGPGATNLITGIADALMDSVPMVCITGQVASPLLGTEAFQEVDIIGMTLSVTKWSYQVTNAEEIPAVIAKAFRIAKEGRPGPVLIDITKDAQVAKLDSFGQARQRSNDLPPAVIQTAGKEGLFAQPEQCLGGYSPAVCMTAGDVASFAQLERRLAAVPPAVCMTAGVINGANRPLILAGHGVLLAGAEGLLVQLAERARIPVACTLHGMSAMPTDHPLYVGMLGMHGNYAPNILTNSADVIIALGMRFDDRVTGRLNAYAKQAKIVHLDIDPYQVDRLVHTTTSLIGDLKETLAELLPHIETALNQAERRAWFSEFERLRDQEQQKVIDHATNPGSGPLKMSEVIHQISQSSRGELLVVADVGQHQMMAARYYDFKHPRSFISSGGLGTMGFALPAAIGAKLGAPHRQVLAVIGDGSFQMTPQELGVIAQEQLDVKILILNNSYLGMVRQWQQLFFDRRYSFVELQNPDFVKLADAYGISGAKIQHRSDLVSGIERMLNHKGAYLLEVAVEAEQNVFPMVPAGCSVSEMRLE